MARRSSSSRKKSRIITVDFSNVEDSQKLVAEGEYICKVVDIEQKEGDKADYLAWKFEILDGDFEGSFLYTNTSLSEQSLWSLRNLMECMGFEVEKKSSDIDIDEFIDSEVGLYVAHDDSYDGRPRSKVTGYFEVKEEKEEKKPDRKSERRARGNGKEEKATTTRRGGKDKKEKKLEALDSADVADMDEGELEEVVDKYDLDVDLEEFKTNRRKANAVIDALESAGHLA